MTNCEYKHPTSLRVYEKPHNSDATTIYNLYVISPYGRKDKLCVKTIFSRLLLTLHKRKIPLKEGFKILEIIILNTKKEL